MYFHFRILTVKEFYAKNNVQKGLKLAQQTKLIGRTVYLFCGGDTLQKQHNTFE